MKHAIVNNCYRDEPATRELMIKRMERCVVEQINDRDYRSPYMPCLPLIQKLPCVTADDVSRTAK